jgi:glutamyl-tRNA reductase
VPGRPRVVAAGLTHHTAGIGLRERAALGEPAACAVLHTLRGAPAVSEAVVLSTCNRTELWAVCTDPGAALRVLRGAHTAHARVTAAELVASGFVRRDVEATRHLFRVAASLDSMVIGETEIQGQVRAARDLAARAGTLGPVLGELFAGALSAGRRARMRTRLGEGAVSVSSVAVALVRERLAGLGGRRAALVGAGRVGEATARALAGHGARCELVTRRDGARLADVLARADVAICATSAPGTVVGVEVVRRARPLVIVDLAVPRDVDPAVAGLAGVELFDLDRLEAAARANLHTRRREGERAARIVEGELARHLARTLPAEAAA